MQLTPTNSLAASAPGQIQGRIASAKAQSGYVEMHFYFSKFVGSESGYDSVANAMRAARNLSSGDDRSSVAVFKSDGGGYRVAALKGFYAMTTPRWHGFGFEHGKFDAYKYESRGRDHQVQLQTRVERTHENLVAMVDGHADIDWRHQDIYGDKNTGWMRVHGETAPYFNLDPADLHDIDRHDPRS